MSGFLYYRWVFAAYETEPLLFHITKLGPLIKFIIDIYQFLK